MHHRKKRNISSKKDMRRLENKSLRAAEKKIIGNGGPPTGRFSGSWSSPIQSDMLPLNDLPSTGKARKKKPRKKKEKCPVNRTHEWYKEIVTKDKTYDGGPWYWLYGSEDRPGFRFESTVRVETCIHCWKERRKTLTYNYIRL